MENQPQLLLRSAMRYGLYLGLVLVAFNILLYLAFDFSNWGYFSMMGIIGLFSFVPFVGGIYVCMKYYRDRELQGFMSYGEGIRFGTTLMLFAGMILAVYNLVFNNWIDPGYTSRLLEILAEKTVVFYEKMGATSAQIDQIIAEFDALKLAEAQSSKMAAPLKSIPINAFYGLVVSLVVSAIVKRKGDPFASAMKNID
jgi:hypothetical protein